MKTDDVIVGVDGSPPSWDALRWAIREAQRRGLTLRVIATYLPTFPAEAFIAGIDVDKAILTRTEELVADMVAHARKTAPGLNVVGLTARGGAAPVLIEAAADAPLLVVAGGRTCRAGRVTPGVARDVPRRAGRHHRDRRRPGHRPHRSFLPHADDSGRYPRGHAALPAWSSDRSCRH